MLPRNGFDPLSVENICDIPGAAMQKVPRRKSAWDFLIWNGRVLPDGTVRKCSLDAKEPLSVFARQRDDFINFHSPQLGELRCDVENIARVVARAAHGDGGHVRAVRFEKDPVERDDARDLDGLLRVFVGQRPVKAQIPAARYELLRDLGAAGVAVEHAAHIRELLYDGKRVGVRVAVVHDDGERKLLRERELRAEDLLLPLFRRVLLPVVVKADLANGDDFRTLRPLPQRVEVLARVGRAVFRVPAHGGVDMRVFLRELHRAARRFEVAAGVDDQPHAVFGHGREQFLAVSVKRLVIIVGVGIKDQIHVVSF